MARCLLHAETRAIPTILRCSQLLSVVVAVIIFKYLAFDHKFLVKLLLGLFPSGNSEGHFTGFSRQSVSVVCT